MTRIAASAPGNVFEEVQLSLGEITSVLEDAERSWLPVSFAVRSTGSVGRPKFEISKDQLEHLVEYELKTPDIAEALGVSVSTIKRRLREFNISSRATLTEISDDDLDSVLRSIHTEFPNAGYRRVLSQLILRGIKVPQRRVRESMQRTDADGVSIRWLSITPRAVYCVSGPLALWHIDGNHKLIRLIFQLTHSFTTTNQLVSRITEPLVGPFPLYSPPIRPPPLPPTFMDDFPFSVVLWE